MPTINIPTPLRKFTENNRTYQSDKLNLNEALYQFVEEYPEVKQNLLDEEGNVRSFIKIYVEDDEVNPGDNGDITLEEDTEVSIVPAIAGGCGCLTRSP